MPDQRRTFAMGRGIRTASRQTTGRTKELSMPRGSTTESGRVTDLQIGEPTRPLRSESEYAYSSKGRDAVGYNSGKHGST